MARLPRTLVPAGVVSPCPTDRQSRLGIRPPRFWIGLVVCLVAFAFLPLALGGCRDKSEADSAKVLVKATEGAVLTCLDGKVSLQIPAGALSEDTEVTLGVLPEKEWTDDMRAVGPLGPICRLQPDGLQLLKPATLSLQLTPDDLAALDLPEETMPSCIVLTRGDDGQWDLMDNLVTLLDADTGQVSVVGETTHFCTGVILYDHVTVDLSPMSVVSSDSEPWSATIGILNYGRVPINVTCVHGATGVVGPLSSPELSKSFTISAKKRASVKANWTCETSGPGTYTAAVQYDRERRYSDWEAAQLELNPGNENPAANPPPDYNFGRRQALLVVSGSASCWVENSPPTSSEDNTTTTKNPNDDRRPICELTFDPNPCDFQEVLVGDTEYKTVTLFNTGSLDATIRGYLWPQGAFDVASTFPRGLKLPVGASYEYTMQFSPASEGDQESVVIVLAEFPYKGQSIQGVFYDRLKGTGVAKEVASLLIGGWWECAQAGTLMTLDFHVSVTDETGGDNPIDTVDLYIDDPETPAYSSGPIEATEWPPPPGMFFERDVTPGTHDVIVKASAANGQVFEQTWDIDCSRPGGGNERFVYWLRYEHTVPGVQSEFYLEMEGVPGVTVNADLSGPGVVSEAHQTGTVGPDGTLRLTWVINRFGSYSVSATIDDTPVSAGLEVVGD